MAAFDIIGGRGPNERHERRKASLRRRDARRKWVSIRGKTYDRLRAYAEQTGREMSEIVAEWVDEELSNGR